MKKQGDLISKVYPTKKDAMRASEIWEKRQKGVCSCTIRPLGEPDPKKPWIFEYTRKSNPMPTVISGQNVQTEKPEDDGAGSGIHEFTTRL